MSNLDSSNAATEPRSGLAGVTGVGGVVWGSLRATFSRIGENISFWSVVGVTVILSTLYYCVFAESMYDSQAILSIQNKGASAGGAARFACCSGGRLAGRCFASTVADALAGVMAVAKPGGSMCSRCQGAVAGATL